MRRLVLPAVVLCACWISGCAGGGHPPQAVPDETGPESAESFVLAAGDSNECVPGLTAALALGPEQRAELRERADAQLAYFRSFHDDWERFFKRRSEFLLYEGQRLETGRLYVGLVKSLTGLRQAVAIDPGYCEVWAMLGHLTSEVGDKDGALADLEKAKCVSRALTDVGRPVDPEVQLRIHRDLAWIHRDQARWDEGLAEVRAGLEFRNGDHDLVLIKGLLLAGAGRFEEAVALSVRMKPFEFPDMRYMHYGLGSRTSSYANRWIRSQAYLAIGDLEMAEHELGDLQNEPYWIELPHMARYFNDVGLVKELAGDEKTAMYYALAFRSREYAGFYPAAPASLTPMVLDTPDPLDLVLTSFGRKFRVGGSLLTYAAVQMDLMSLSSVPRLKQEAAARALQALDIAEKRNIRPSVCRAMRGRIHYQNDRFGEARPELAAARAAFDEQGCVDAGTCQLLGMIELREGRYDSAVPFFEETVAADPDAALGWRHLGVALSKTGQIGRAGEALDRAVRLEPHSVVGLYNRGLFHCHRGDYAAALPDLQRALEIDPGNAQVIQLLQRAATKVRAGEGGTVTAAAVETSDPAILPAAGFDGDTDALLMRLSADLDAFFCPLQPDPARQAELEKQRERWAADYREQPDPQCRRSLARVSLQLCRFGDVRRLLEPHWGVDLEPDESVMLLFADQKLGDPLRAGALGRALVDGSAGTENPYLWTLAVQAAGREPSDQEAQEIRLAFERFVSFNMNFLGNPADQWSRFFAHAFGEDAGATEVEIPPEWRTPPPAQSGNSEVDE